MDFGRGEELSIYIESIKNCKTFTKEEEIDLAIKKENGDKTSFDLLVSSCLKFVVSMARKFVNKKVDIMDLIQAGNIGLMRAVEKFNYRKDVRLISYSSWWIRQKIILEILNHDPTHIPLNISSDVNYMMKEIISIRDSCGCLDKNIEYYLDIYISKYGIKYSKEIILRVIFIKSIPNLSFDRQSIDNDEVDFYELIEDPNRDNFEESALSSHFNRIINISMEERLQKREKRILEQLFGLNGVPEMTLEEISLYENISRERVRQIGEKIKNKLKSDKEILKLKC